MSTISTHVLDTAHGRPAAGVAITLERVEAPGVEAVPLSVGVTDADGRVRDLLAAVGASVSEGTYRLRFEVGEYFARAGRDAFYPEVTVTFHVAAGEEHYHVPLLLSPFGYSTYRGS
jgi:5-hydroxyisourate hydrolase